MKLIPLTQGKFAIVDDEDFDLVNRFKWHYTSLGYAIRNARVGDNYPIYMHRLIIDAPSNRQVDHISTDKLDNRKKNLRLATVHQNRCNRGKTIKNTSGYKGVFLDKRDSTWYSKIKTNGKQIYLGRFKCPEDAAASYAVAARSYHGEFART